MKNLLVKKMKNLFLIGYRGTGKTVLGERIAKELNKNFVDTDKIIIEIAYQEIQKSPSYNSGFGLRFPRFIRLRTGDKDEPDSLNRIKRIYKKQ